jgi:hypothetical protein
MIPRLFIAATVGVASLIAAPMTTAGPGFLRTAQTDAARASVADANPSKAEPMMLGPTPEDDAANYRQDFVACESQPGAQRESCRAAVDREYRPEVTNLAGGCDVPDSAAKAECLRGNGSER